MSSQQTRPASAKQPFLQEKSLAEVADFLGEEVRLEGDASWRVRGVASLAEAGSEDLSFCASADYASQLAASHAGCVLLPEHLPAPQQIPHRLRCSNPQVAFARMVAWLYQPWQPEVGVDKRAWVHASAEIDASASVMPGVYVGAHSKVGAGCVLYPGVVVLGHCQLGRNCVLFPHVTLREETVLGDGVRLHAGVVLGTDGYGYVRQKEELVKLPQVGHVVIEDGVEIGSLTTVDRATMGHTQVGAGSKFDSLVHIGHNVKIGKRVLLVAGVLVGGSAKLADDVSVGGATAVVPHIAIGKGSTVYGFSMVSKSVPDGTQVSGIPARPRLEENRRQAAVNSIAGLQQRVKNLEAEVKNLQAALKADANKDA